MNTVEADKTEEAVNYTTSQLSGASGGAWSFFGDPRALKRGDDLYTGWINTKGYVQVAKLNLETGKKDTATLAPNLGRPDDHNNPSLAMDKSGRLTAYYSPHSGRMLPLTGKSRMYYRTTKKPGDLSSWTKVRHIPTNSPGRLGHTYPNPIDIGKGRTWLSWRGGNWLPTSAVKTPNGWTRARSYLKGIASRRPYAKYAPGPGNSILMAYNEDNPGTSNTSLYYLRYKPGKGYFTANGRKIGGESANIAVNNGHLVESNRAHGRTWIMDIATDSKGRPAMVYAAGRRNHKMPFYYARWRNGKWQKSKIVTSGYSTGAGSLHNYGHYPTAGASLDHSDPSQVYTSRAKNGEMVVEKWQPKAENDLSQGWQSERVSPRGLDCTRPVVPRGSKGGNVVLMMCGVYRTWTNFNTGIFMARKNQA